MIGRRIDICKLFYKIFYTIFHTPYYYKGYICLTNQRSMEKVQREKRNAAVKKLYKEHIGHDYIPDNKRGASGSSYIIRAIAKRYDITPSNVYLILKS